MTNGLRYRPANLADVTPVKPLPPPGIPSAAVNVGIIAAGLGIGLLAYPYRKKELGSILVPMGGSIAGVGFVFAVLDALGGRPS